MLAESRKCSQLHVAPMKHKEFAEQVAEKTNFSLKPIQVEPSPSFIYTTPSALGKRPAESRRSRGCIEKEVPKWCFKEKGSKKDKCAKSEAEAIKLANGQKVTRKADKKFTGYRCSDSSNTSESCKDSVYDSFCAGEDKEPCAVPRRTCPVQLVWINGKPNLRFCKSVKAPGHLVPVKNVKDAMELSAKACELWPYKLGVVESSDGSDDAESGWDDMFFDRNAPEVIQRASEAYPKTGGLGEYRKSGSSWLPLVAIVAALAVYKFSERSVY